MAKTKSTGTRKAPAEPTSEVYVTANTVARDGKGAMTSIGRFTGFKGPASSCLALVAAGKAVAWDPDTHTAAVKAAAVTAKAVAKQPNLEV